MDPAGCLGMPCTRLRPSPSVALAARPGPKLGVGCSKVCRIPQGTASAPAQRGPAARTLRGGPRAQGAKAGLPLETLAARQGCSRRRSAVGGLPGGLGTATESRAVPVDLPWHARTQSRWARMPLVYCTRPGPWRTLGPPLAAVANARTLGCGWPGLRRRAGAGAMACFADPLARPARRPSLPLVLGLD